MAKTPETPAEALAAVAEHYGITIEEVLRIIHEAAAAVTGNRKSLH
jgi:putative heme iron utilization protein